MSDKREGTVSIHSQFRPAVCVVWRSPVTGEECVAYGSSKDEAQRNQRFAVLRELTAHGVELADNPTVKAE